MRLVRGAGLVVLLTSCVTYTPKPLDPRLTAGQLEQRTLDSPAVRATAERAIGHPVEPWPPGQWSLDVLSAAAFALNPEVAVARAEYEVARAGIVSARE